MKVNINEYVSKVKIVPNSFKRNGAKTVNLIISFKDDSQITITLVQEDLIKINLKLQAD